MPSMTLERPGGPAAPGSGLSGTAAARGCWPRRPSRAGAGARALDAVRVQRALGSRSPSLAVATTMHHFSMVTLVGLSNSGEGLEWMLVQAVATENQLMASGLAEGRGGTGILSPSMSATPTPEWLRITGVKRPCSLARSMDLLTASVLVPREGGAGQELAVALVPAAGEGLGVSGFWSSGFLAGAESDQVTLGGVLVPPDLMVRTACPPGARLDEVQAIDLVWFELLMTGSYLGAASALAAARAPRAPRPPWPRARSARARSAGALAPRRAALR
ncbi:acyl-CoA dehydrogenase [Streptomyces sp. NPDC058319]|uniref:acyl-CoA dehydrogenase n=1 Tax=unclassified Streptomyces TaxID=2593676 RepID=UPI0036E29FCF